MTNVEALDIFYLTLIIATLILGPIAIINAIKKKLKEFNKAE